MMEKGEFELIDWIKGQFPVPDGILGIGDDCAVLPQREGVETLVSTDMLVEGVHFLLEDIDPYSLGWKSAAVNLSDIAGMGGKPVGTFLCCALPKGLDESFLEGFFNGYKAISDRFDCPLLGGDTTSSKDRLCINVTALGECPAGHSHKRSQAMPGDLVCVTGPLGDSGAGLKIILEGSAAEGMESTLRERHYRPVPRVEEGIRLASTPGVNAMMDISDGIGSDLRHILKASGAAARVDVRSLPLSAEMQDVCQKRGWDPVELATGGGEDYELLFTCRPGTSIPVAHTVIGEILATGSGHDAGTVEWIGGDRDYKGFRHF